MPPSLHPPPPSSPPTDLSVAVISAWDADDHAEGTNARLTYSIEKNVIHERSGEAIFIVHPHTGLIRTALCCLDRETTPEYTIQVVATDGGGLKGTGTVVVRLADVNDNSPRLTRQLWELEVEETWGTDAPANTTLLEITAADRDTANYFFYRWFKTAHLLRQKVESVPIRKNVRRKLLPMIDPKGLHRPIRFGTSGVAGVVRMRASSLTSNLLRVPRQVVERSGWGWEHFGVRAEGAVGHLYARQTLDYEDDTHRRGFKFMIQVTDRGRGGWQDPRHLDSAWVAVKLRDLNDNPPTFSRSHSHVTVKEDTQPGTLLTTLSAHDPDMKRLSSVRSTENLTGTRARAFGITVQKYETLLLPPETNKEQ
ncbi:putative neural-cadherin 2 [Penaeus indicus]|uniref:putative neural-cadherin 2 n=1 Tax=Penaeus indicus TaxID=29960 RepID=UPI00300C143C